MLMRTDPLRDFDRLARQLFGTVAQPAAMPMDAYRSGEDLVVHFDLPGIDPETIDLDVERNVLSVRAERRTPTPEGAEVLAAERPSGSFGRQLFLGESLDTKRIDASYDAGVLTVRIPVAEEAKPRKIQITGGSVPKEIVG
ncbi:Hsp20/alpha crystallin family protein [Streptantibioticus ferralitis]|uniref:Hsp20/alpha crystallin family protein n=1 Tax=Streptantibioticus ferralitis TaxID=236510 RepID=A0ABT5Z430_9ACTN|nr:Hsp20/alpha crystallin family protein [Streptantibioticus ferralitis]MDF2258459.1 Hsp20/alpha crystallin family protein [Streptantibioticus ferralitis]